MPIDPDQSLHQGRFPGSILADQRMYLAGPQGQVDAVQNRHVTESDNGPSQHRHHGAGGRPGRVRPAHRVLPESAVDGFTGCTTTTS